MEPSYREFWERVAGEMQPFGDFQDDVEFVEHVAAVASEVAEAWGFTVLPGVRLKVTNETHVICRGCWTLDSACGKCSRCVEEARSIVYNLRKRDHHVCDAAANVIEQQYLNRFTDTADK